MPGSIEDIKIALRLDPKVKILPCVAKDQGYSQKLFLLELLYLHPGRDGGRVNYK